MIDNNQLFKTIFEQSPLSTQIFSPQGDMIMANKAWEILWGIKRSELKKYNILQDQQLAKKGIMKYIKRGFKGEVVQIPPINYVPSETVNIHGAVAFRWVQAVIYPITNNKGETEKIVLQHEDITDRIMAEEALKMSEERLRVALKAGTIGVWDWDIKNDKIIWSDEVYQIHDVPKRDDIGDIKQYLDDIHPDDKQWVDEAIQQSIKKRTPYKLEFRIVTPSREVRWVSASGQVIYDDQHHPTRMIGATMNVTDRKLLEQRKDDFISMASHELKTPITSMIMFLELLERQITKTSDDRLQMYVAKVKDQTGKLRDLINNLLDISRLETGKITLHKEQIAFDSFAKDIIDTVQLMTTKHEILLTGNVQVQIYADKYRLYQVITNLLTNAIKYSPTKSQIVVDIKKDIKTGVIIVSVKDKGIGIQEREQKKIFDKLYQVNDENKSYPGLGIGLYIAREIITRHGGEMWVESRKGNGSTFYFTLPDQNDFSLNEKKS